MKRAAVLFLLSFFCCCEFVVAKGRHRHLEFQSHVDELVQLDRSFNTFEPEIPLSSEPLALDNFAQYLKLFPVEYVSIPVRINLIFLGFEGDGNRGLNVKQSELEEWFHHFEHEISQLIVPFGEHQTTIEHFATPKTKIKFRLSFNVVQLAPLVNTILEDTILWNMRSEHPEFSPILKSQERHYVNVYSVSSLLNHLLEYLNLQDSYSILILNPKKALDQNQIYGYRAGFSDLEILTVKQALNLSIVQKPKPSTTTNTQTQKKDLEFFPERSTNFTSLAHESEIWANWYIRKYDMKLFVDEADRIVDEEDTRNVRRRFQNQLENILDFVQEMGETGTPFEKEYLTKIFTRPQLQENCMVDGWVAHERFAFIDLSAGPFEWGPTIAGEGVRTHTSFPVVPLSGYINAPPTSDISDLNAWLHNEIYQLNHVRSHYCESRKATSTDCRNIEKRIRELEIQIKKAESTQSVDLKDLVGSLEEGEEADIERDKFLAHLGSSILAALHHVFLPPSPLFTSPFTERVLFDFYLVMQHNEYDPFDKENFDFQLYKKELLKFKLPSQEFRFSLTKVFIADDPTVAAAYSAALRMSMIPTVNVHGQIYSASRLYLDSTTLQHFLVPIQQQHQQKQPTETHDHSQPGGEHSWWQHSRVIPVFMFSVNHKSPVLIDKYYQAKALTNFVLIVQSKFTSFESRFHCNGKPIYWNLRDPLRSALSATALILGGLIPNHLFYNEAHEAAMQNWMWSMGDNPLSLTSQNTYHFSKIQQDIVLRSYLLHSLNSSISLINSAIHLLYHRKVDSGNNQLLSSLPLKELVSLYNETKSLWLIAMEEVGLFRFEKATQLLQKFELSSRRFYAKAKQMSHELDLRRCKEIPTSEKPPYSYLDWLFPASLLFDILLLAFFFVLPKRKPKSKIN